MLGTYEFSDFPMDPETFGVKPGEHIPGVAIQRYLTAYAENFGVHGKIRFETTVESAELIGGGTWLVRYVYGSSGKNEIVGARKLVIATGMTSQVNMPVIKGSENFKGRILHAKEMANNKMLEHSEHAVVLGGSKSAADAVYTNASKGNTVDWVIRSIAFVSVQVVFRTNGIRIRQRALLDNSCICNSLEALAGKAHYSSFLDILLSILGQHSIPWSASFSSRDSHWPCNNTSILVGSQQ
jgi:cation diffusion facilitator CzcD-associated flavoprotein CzcO